MEDHANVLHITERSIAYQPTFKLAALKAYQEGKTPAEIFREAGFNLDMIGRENPNRCLKRWRKTFASQGEAGLLEEQRGKGSTGRPAAEQSMEKKLAQAAARIKLLEAEKRLPKKARGARETSPAEPTLTPSERFELINRTLRKHQLEKMTHHLCKMANVSKSGYYRWLAAEQARQLREEADEQDLLLIREHFEKRNGKVGALVLKMCLEHKSGVIMNHKKIRRIMRKYGLVAKIRQANPYRKLAKATQEHQTLPNHLKRQFDQGEPEKVFLTDITYLHYGQGQCAYLSCVKDGASKQILAHYVSSSLEMTIVDRTLDRLIQRLDGNIHPEAIIHSDQGFHYANPRFQARVKEIGFQQSMSRKSNCWDNASMESFFGHMKDELEYRDSVTLQELRARINEYMDYYNTDRYQWTLKKMTPDEYRNHLLTA
ncbi:IS3 family transposase [Paenibacillus brasilensis]|uniref:IS3 family transposase n=1 Tax=Paenibacillus brasilensis TaxID=128574 RepID=UPI0012669151|nr:IS3 family transposase [Paenibacillus brasilensis]